MSKIDVVLNTEMRDYVEGARVNRKMTKQRIRFNTDVVFAVAKQNNLPLDKTASMMIANSVFDRIHHSYSRRKKISIPEFIKSISLELQ